ncbi:peptidoglycan bridge formation glycyltransferase FemA/FemB family protein [Pseudolactococcus piscium]|nr:peptidoglycan bridge formation glycyltransferase FemA/FemB family protein [Lactococcus piscium]
MDSRQFVAVSAAEFELFVDKRDDMHFQQTKNFGELQTALGHQAYYFAVKNQDKLVAAILVTLAKVKFGYLAEAHGNPYFSEDHVTNQVLISGLKKVLKKQGVLKLVVHSNVVQRTYDDNWEKTAELNQALADFYQELGLKQIQLSEFEKGFNYNYSKDLSGYESFAKVEKSYKKNGLQTIKKARKLGIKVYEARFDELSDFKKVVDEAGERRKFATRDLSYYEAVHQAYGDRVKFILAKLNFNSELRANQIELDNIQAEIRKAQEQNKLKSLDTLGQRVSRLEKLHEELSKFVGIYGDQDVILSAAQFFVMPNEVIYMFSGMYDEFREFSAPFLIQDYMLKYAYAHQIDQYNFMGVNAPDNPDQGVLKFKQNFKGYIWQSSGNYELVIKPLINKITEALKKIIAR